VAKFRVKLAQGVTQLNLQFRHGLDESHGWAASP
jgi:hypothetical protein